MRLLHNQSNGKTKRCRVSLVGWALRYHPERARLRHGGPYKADQLPGTRHDGAGAALAVPHHVPVPVVESLLDAPGLGLDVRRLALALLGEAGAEPQRVAVGLARFDQDPAGVCVPGLGDAAPVLPLPRGGLTGHQAQVGHGGARHREALEVPNSDEQDHGRERVDAPDSSAASPRAGGTGPCLPGRRSPGRSRPADARVVRRCPGTPGR